MGRTELKIELDTDLLKQARDAGVDVTAVTEAALRRVLPAADATERARQWAEENAGAIQAHEERIERIGVFGEDLRTW